MAHALVKYEIWVFWCFAWLATNNCYAEFCPKSSAECSQPGAPCTIIRDETCSLSSQMDKPAERYPGPVTSFSVTTTYVNPQVTSPSVSQSNVLMKWNLPANGTYRYLNGFEIRIWDTTRSSKHCFIYNITGATWSFDTASRQYIFNCTTLEEGYYQMEVTSLPRAPFSRMRAEASVYIKHKAAQDVEICRINSCWVSDLVIYTHPCNRSLTVSFNMAPPSESIVYYIVSLLKPDSLKTENKETVPKDEHQNRGIATLKVPESVKTAVIKLIPSGPRCSFLQCTITQSEPFNIPDVDYDLDCTFNQLPEPIRKKGNLGENNFSPYEIVGIILGSVLLAAIVVAIVVLLARNQNRRDENADETSKSCSQQALVDNYRRQKKGKLRPLCNKAAYKRKTVVLLYANDNKYHQNVIGNFKEFMKRHCHCDVIYDVEHQRNVPDNKSTWIRQVMESSDYILLLSSEGAYHRARAIQNGLFYPPNDCDSCLGDMFTLAFEILLEDADGLCRHSLADKLILAHFSYTAPEFRSPPLLPDVHRKKNYRLMADVDSLCAHIHAESPPRARSICCPDHVSELGYETTAEGQLLAQAISYSETYLRTNPNWFVEIHGRPMPKGQQSFPTVAPVPMTTINYTDNVRKGGFSVGGRNVDKVAHNVDKLGAYKEIRNPNLYVNPTLDQMSMNSSTLADLVDDINRYG